MSQEEFLADKRNPAVTESYLRRCLEAVFDLSRHILAKSYGFKELEYKNFVTYSKRLLHCARNDESKVFSVAETLPVIARRLRRSNLEKLE